ncbi:hypothetical protein QOT17_014083 [Balamuthia mandrillaris]
MEEEESSDTPLLPRSSSAPGSDSTISTIGEEDEEVEGYSRRNHSHKTTLQHRIAEFFRLDKTDDTHAATRPSLTSALLSSAPGLSLLDSEDDHLEKALPAGASGTTNHEERALHRFLLRLALALHMYGAPANKTEGKMMYVCERLGLQAAFIVFPTTIVVSLGKADFSSSQTYLLSDSPSLHCEKLYWVNRLANDVAAEKLTIDEAEFQLQCIIKGQDRFNPLWTFVGDAIFAAGIVPLFFKGGWRDVPLAGFMGFMVSTLCWLSGKWPALAATLEVVSAFMVTVLTTLWSQFVVVSCVPGVTLGGIVALLPGLRMTIAVQEMAEQSIVSGSARMFSAFIIFIELGFGLAIGGRFLTWVNPHEPAELCGEHLLSAWWNFLFLPLCCISSSVQTKAHPWHWFPMGVVAVVGYAISWATTEHLNFQPDTSAALAAFGVGVLANFWSRYNRHPTIIYTIAGILLLVPGSMGLKGVASLLQNEVVEGINFGFKMIVISLSIAVGLVIASLIFRTKSRRRQTKSL